MAKKKEKVDAGAGADSLLASFISDIKQSSTSVDAYLSGDHGEHTWGVPVPKLAPAYLITSTVLPCQRNIGVSGERSSFKSTLMYEIGNWFIAPQYDKEYPNEDGGMHFAIDTEDKTSASMNAAMSRGAHKDPKRVISRRAYVLVKSMEAWMKVCTDVIYTRGPLAAARRPGSRLPIFLSVDSIMAKATQDAQVAIQREGHAEGRAFPVGHAAITNYLEGTSLHGTTITFGYVQHMKDDINSQGHGKQYREKGASAVAFHSSIHIRMKLLGANAVSGHPARWQDGPTVDVRTLRLTTHKNCVGPDKRKLDVDLIWQYLDEPVLDADGQPKLDEDGKPVTESVQYMKYDWDGALANLLFGMKYAGKDQLPAFELQRLNDYLSFTASGAGVKRKFNCEELGLEGVSSTEFGLAIDKNPKVRDRVRRLLNIQEFPTLQEADIDLSK